MKVEIRELKGDAKVRCPTIAICEGPPTPTH